MPRFRGEVRRQSSGPAPAFGHAFRDDFGNLAILIGDDNSGKKNRPLHWSAEFLKRHFIPADQSLWHMEKYEYSLIERRKLLKARIQKVFAFGKETDATLRRESYFGFGLRLKLIALQPQRNDSGAPRGVTCTQASQVSQRKHARSALNAATTGSKSFFPKLAHSL